MVAVAWWRWNVSRRRQLRVVTSTISIDGTKQQAKIDDGTVAVKLRQSNLWRRRQFGVVTPAMFTWRPSVTSARRTEHRSKADVAAATTIRRTPVALPSPFAQCDSSFSSPFLVFDIFRHGTAADFSVQAVYILPDVRRRTHLQRRLLAYNVLPNAIW